MIIKTLVRNHLSQETASEWFMILDNADDEAIWGKGELSCDRTLTKYLPKTLNGSILVTTRTRKLATSQAGKEVIELREMEPGEAFSTFHSLLEGVTHTALDPTTSKLLEKLTYLPLAVVQAASYLNERQESVETYLELLDDAEQHVIDLLEEDFRDSTRYPESKNPVALTWSSLSSMFASTISWQRSISITWRASGRRISHSPYCLKPGHERNVWMPLEY